MLSRCVKNVNIVRKVGGISSALSSTISFIKRNVSIMNVGKVGVIQDLYNFCSQHLCTIKSEFLNLLVGFYSHNPQGLLLVLRIRN